MTKKELKENFLNYFEARMNDIKLSEELDCYYVSGIDSRELLGVIQFMWYFDLITDKENKDLRSRVYDHLTIAERQIKHSL